MKKIKLFSALALALVMTSCDDFDLPNPPGQTNTDPEAYFADADLELAPVSEAISLKDANAANQYVTVGNIVKLENFPADYTFEVDMELGNDAGFSKSMTLPTTIDGNALTLDPSVINGAIQNVISKAPGQYDVNARFSAYAVKGNTRLRLGGIDKYYLTEELNITTYDADKVIENAYWMIPCDAAGTPNWDAAVEMNNTYGAGANGYDHPEFSLKIESPAPDGYYFLVAPQSVKTSQIADQLLGGNPAADGFSGKLGSEYSVIHVEITGDVLITINMEQDSYALSYAFPVLYPFNPGSLKVEDTMKLYTDNYVTYSGVCAINNKWYLGAYPDKKAEPLFKQSAAEEPVESEDGLSMTGLLSSGDDATNIGVPVNGKGNVLFYVSVNLPQLTYSMNAINDLSLIGAFNSWSHDTSVSLAPSAKTLKGLSKWTATDVELDGEFKIAANKAWDIDFGGVSAGTDNAGNLVYHLSYKGGNMTVESGKYDVTIDFTAQPYVLTLKKK